MAVPLCQLWCHHSSSCFLCLPLLVTLPCWVLFLPECGLSPPTCYILGSRRTTTFPAISSTNRGCSQYSPLFSLGCPRGNLVSACWLELSQVVAREHCLFLQGTCPPEHRRMLQALWMVLWPLSLSCAKEERTVLLILVQSQTPSYFTKKTGTLENSTNSVLEASSLVDNYKSVLTNFMPLSFALLIIEQVTLGCKDLW
jgi:hypothetical protein